MVLLDLDPRLDEARIVGRNIDIPDEGVGGLDRGDPGQRKRLGQTLLQTGKDALPDRALPKPDISHATGKYEAGIWRMRKSAVELIFWLCFFWFIPPWRRQ